MLMLPKFKKGMKQAMTQLEKASKVIVGVALVAGLTAGVFSSGDAQASIANPSVVNASQGAMMLAPSTSSASMLAYHYSHSSHSSHESHSSHYSHYSSRY